MHVGLMLPRATQRFLKPHKRISRNLFNGPMGLFSTTPSPLSEHDDLLRRPQRSERKPLVTGINELKRRARIDRKRMHEVREIPLQPPDNGLLVKGLVPVAHEVFAARTELFNCVSRVIEVIPVHACRVCGEVHVGTYPHEIRTCDVAGSLPTKEHSWRRGGIEHVLPLVESFHLYDRLGRAVSHEEQLEVDRIPAIMELCVQAGVDIPEYPTKRRVIPVYNIAGKMIDFERKFPRDYSIGKDIQPSGFWVRRKNTNVSNPQVFSYGDDIKEIAVGGMEAWERVRSGSARLMKKYLAQTCGFCPEVQVGPKGHRARICRAYKHQMRDGQHAWQLAAVDDLVPPVHVWHVVPDGAPLRDELRRFYGKLPAAVELFAQAGAIVPEGYRGLMRCDVTVPRLDEAKWAV